MDIRTKLVFAFVAVALASMATLGAFAYEATASLLEQITLRQLDALAESKKRDLRKVIEGWIDHVQLIGTRTQLRASLVQFSASGAEEERLRIQQILGDALGAGAEVSRVTLFDAHGREVVLVGQCELPPAQWVPPPPAGEVLLNAYPRPGGGADVGLYVPMVRGGETLGALEVVLDAVELDNVAENYTGLGETGEVLVVAQGDPGGPRLLNALRHADDEASRAAAVEALDVLAALSGQERTFKSDVVDYRGEPVWSATRYLPEAGWGIVVKVDAAEEEAPVLELRGMLFDLALALGAFAVLAGTLLGLYMARPIRSLAELVQRIRAGETELRADVRSEDEVAYLGRSLNELMDDLARNDAEHRAPWSSP